MNRFKQLAEEAEEFKRSFAATEFANEPLSEETQKLFRKIQQRLMQVPGEMRLLSAALAKRGWYISMDMPFKFLYTVRHLLDAGKIAEVDDLMLGYLDHYSRSLEKLILTAFPARSAILSAALRANRKKDYFLSVPAFLAQADGICAEILGVGFYSRSKGTPKTASVVERFANSPLMSSLLEPLRVAGALNAFEDERHQYPDILNRHEVLHGKSIDYGTRLNSFRALSLLGYLSSTLVSAKEYQEYLNEKNSEQRGA